LPETAWLPVWDELRQHGYVQGAPLSVDRRGFEARYEQFPKIVADLIQGKPDVIMCGGDAAIRAVQTATSSIPIVAITDDMVGAGLVRSLARPGGNTTGISILAADLDGKRQEILLDYVPMTRRMAALSDAQNNTSAQIEHLLEAARSRGIVLSIQRVQRSEDISPALDAAKASGATALNVLASPLLQQIAAVSSLARPSCAPRDHSSDVAAWCACAAGMAFLIGTAALSIGTLPLLTQAEEPKQDRKVIDLAEVTCKTFTELTREEQNIITAWLQGYHLPEQEPAVIDVEKMLSDKAKLTEHCINKPEDDVMTAAEAVME
jgi:ABC transporter substrate binding protein/HdeA/HdeB family